MGIPKKFRRLISIPYQILHECHKSLYRTGILKSKKLERPVISVGNLSFGGTGKTPFTMYLADKLSRSFNLKVCILSRAYKARIPKSLLPILIDTKNINEFTKSEYVHGTKETNYLFIGDEPTQILDLIKDNPLISMAIDSDRYAAAKKSMEEINPDIFILDDAQQHLKIKKDLNIILLNTNERGYYREFSKNLREADCVIYSKVNNHWLLQEENKDKVAISYTLKLEPEIDRDKNIRAFAGLADNRYFFKILEDTLKSDYFQKEFKTLSFPDHHDYSIDEIEDLIQLNENLICTSKDLVKIPDEYKKNFIEAKLEL